MEVQAHRFRSLKYRVAPTFRFFRSNGEYVLTITPDADTTLPELVLVVKDGGIPLNPKNGNVVLRIPAGSMCAPRQPLTVTFRGDSLPERWRARLFVAQDDDCNWLDLIEET